MCAHIYVCVDIHMLGARCGGIKEMGGNLRPARVPVLWVGGCGELPHAFHVALGGYLAVRSYRPSPQGVDKGQS